MTAEAALALGGGAGTGAAAIAGDAEGAWLGALIVAFTGELAGTFTDALAAGVATGSG